MLAKLELGMLKHQINLVPDTPADVSDKQQRFERGFIWWSVPSPRGWVLVNDNFGYVALVPNGDEKLVNRVGNTAIETVQKLAPGDQTYLAASISQHFDDIVWQVSEDTPEHVQSRIARVFKLAEKSQDQFQFEKAVERENKAEPITLLGRTFMPEDGFIGLLQELDDDLDHYITYEGFWTRVFNLIRGKRPWLGD